jgi:hypothetical protein
VNGRRVLLVRASGGRSGLITLKDDTSGKEGENGGGIPEWDAGGIAPAQRTASLFRSLSMYMCSHSRYTQQIGEYVLLSHVWFKLCNCE